MSKVILADSAGFCFGVQRAVDEAIKVQKQYNKKIYTLGPLIHNNDVVNYLKENNIHPEKMLKNGFEFLKARIFDTPLANNGALDKMQGVFGSAS